ncbi:hypothetical protein PYCCODRAFT_452973 [Trametes coccinea BRFM310]|uniref:Uncharacterized protein n=1 Tax=Trametes coccinea (strain BRFM310) TaxID=1353009 RepID=A0A1Y2IMG7_TRAC3|nr:hypothetical protein PYCCODRAFT_452973 [Trametes coccinea BRFM310]
MAISKNITITGCSLDAPVTLTLGFLPPTADFRTVIPIAWRVIELTTGVSESYLWTNVIGACRAIIDSDSSTVTPGTHSPIPIGRSADLLKVPNRRPPAYRFSDLTPYDQRKSRVINRTNGYIDIGAGYITDLDKPSSEEFHPVLVCRRVLDATPAYVDYVPELNVWANLDYAESELLSSSVKSIKPLWHGNLTEITGKQIMITVKHVDGVLVADGPTAGGSAGTPALPTAVKDMAVVYKVDLAFATPNLVSVGVKAIVDQLVPQGYTMKSTTKMMCCDQAERDLLLAIEANQNLYGKAYLKGHSGAAMVASDIGLETWVEINPATAEWFGRAQVAVGTSAAFGGQDADAFDKAGKGGEAITGREGNGDASVTGSGDEEEERPVSPAVTVSQSGGDEFAEKGKVRPSRRDSRLSIAA